MSILRRSICIEDEDLDNKGPFVVEDETATKPAETDQPMVTLSGPLAGVYAKALHAAYANDRQPTTVGNESQALNAFGMQAAAQALAAERTPPRIYALSKNTILPQNLMEVTTKLVESQDGEENVIIIDEREPEGMASGPAEGGGMVAAMEHIATALGGKVYFGLEAFLEARYGK